MRLIITSFLFFIGFGLAAQNSPISFKVQKDSLSLLGYWNMDTIEKTDERTEPKERISTVKNKLPGYWKGETQVTQTTHLEFRSDSTIYSFYDSEKRNNSIIETGYYFYGEWSQYGNYVSIKPLSDVPNQIDYYYLTFDKNKKLVLIPISKRKFIKQNFTSKKAKKLVLKLEESEDQMPN